MLFAVAALVLGITATFARAQQRNWLAPGPLCATYWLIACAAPLLVFGGTYVSGRSVLAIAVGTAALTFGTCLALARLAPGEGIAIQELPVPMAAPTLRQSALRRLVLTGTVSGFLAMLVSVHAHGLRIANALSVNGLLQTGHALSISRYASGQGGGSATVAALLGLTYAAAIVSPFTLLDRRRRFRHFRATAPAVSALAYSLLTTEHLAMLLATAMTISGYLAMRIFSDGRSPRISLTRVLKVSVISVIIFIAFVGISFVRVGGYDSSLRPVILSKIEVYAFGYLPAFSSWLDTRLDGRDLSYQLGYGTSSLPGIGTLTGQSRAATRSYNDKVLVGSSGQASNVFSWWRNFIVDFGFAGGALVLALFGWLMGRLYRAVITTRAPAAASGLACCYTTLLLSTTFTVTTFTNVAAGFAIAIWFLGRAGRVQPRRAARSARHRHGAFPLREVAGPQEPSLTGEYGGRA